MSICSEMLSDPFGIFESLMKSANFKFSCPLHKRFYAVTYGILNFSKFPPHIPPGRYRNQIKFFDYSNFVSEIFVDVETVEVIKKWKN
ncbi:hypothetical protein ILUMI_02384 [Ignelater luminosus]|uniref:Uncharacterized protein n=1 Tax=Ignelater luminosus TaxID=2038154 RepID=A0A8K0GN77_IGNLU|nr:hypothetical protein ILUMI_02384 [Ignelater luminosus]